jgi:trafficking protein particle complex subunit 13
VSNIKILAEMQTPSASMPLTLTSLPEASSSSTAHLPGTSLQHIITFSIKEEGTHVLAVNVSYTETILSPPPPSNPDGPSVATSSRTRSFRKLYQFPTVPCLSVRTKATELPTKSVPDKSGGPYGRTTLLRYTLEAQLENVSDGTIVLESAVMHAKAPFTSTALNWDSDSGGAAATIGADESPPVTSTSPLLAPRDVFQLTYLLSQQPGGAIEATDELKMMLKRDGRAVLGQLSIGWRSDMGEKGSLTTGGLLTRKKFQS